MTNYFPVITPPYKLPKEPFIKKGDWAFITIVGILLVALTILLCWAPTNAKAEEIFNVTFKQSSIFKLMSSGKNPVHNLSCSVSRNLEPMAFNKKATIDINGSIRVCFVHDVVGGHNTITLFFDNPEIVVTHIPSLAQVTFSDDPDMKKFIEDPRN